MPAPPAETSRQENITLRPMSDADRPFLKRVYAGTRSEELAQTPWSVEEKEAFLKMQFEAQHDFYQKQFPSASYQIVERNGAPIGRLYLDRRPGELRVIDIALLPEERGAGIGGRLMQDVLDEAALLGKPVRIHVERNNPAMHLYDRLGFRRVEDQGVYWLMECTAGSKKNSEASAAG